MGISDDSTAGHSYLRRSSPGHGRSGCPYSHHPCCIPHIAVVSDNISELPHIPASWLCTVARLQHRIHEFSSLPPEPLLIVFVASFFPSVVPVAPHRFFRPSSPIADAAGYQSSVSILPGEDSLSSSRCTCVGGEETLIRREMAGSEWSLDDLPMATRKAKSTPLEGNSACSQQLQPTPPSHGTPRCVSHTQKKESPHHHQGLSLQ